MHDPINPDYITTDALKVLFRQALAEQPDIRNAEEDGACIYTSTTDPDHHCAVGQVLTDLGYDTWAHPETIIPGLGPTSAETVTMALGWPAKARSLAGRVQSQADEGLKWGSVLDTLEIDGAL